MNDTSLTGVYGTKEIQNTSKKYIDGKININNDNEQFMHVAEVPLIIHSLIQNVHKTMSTLGTKNPREQNRFKRDAENCCRLIENYMAATLYGNLDTFPSTKFNYETFPFLSLLSSASRHPYILSTYITLTSICSLALTLHSP